MNEEIVPEVERLKKRKAKIIAGGITFVIFCLWLSYFILSMGEERTKEKPFAFFDNLKQNTVKPIEDMKGFFNEVVKNFSGAVATSSVTQIGGAAQTDENIVKTTTQE